ncbi:MAG: phosphoribosylformylglycinamidine synthase subunit PurL [Actinomycetota bacterium]|nr:phosphoribosylformylglycinamidine synthase subunit PurL [Actinomycetota bacterium]
MTPDSSSITPVELEPGIHRELGLTDDELEAIKARLGRTPTFVELAMFSVMWSEHCSYKSSRVHLKDLPNEGPHILVGPGEGAGIIEVAPGVAVAWKIESHNHPSFVEPFNGAATGVGGIVRDILSMGARPIALLDSLRFGPPDDPRTSYLVDGVVHGISSYGNSIGVPTVGGETVFEECYAANPLVNAACLGVIEDKLMSGTAQGDGNSVVLFGSRTGRDGIGGASVLASAEFDEGSLEKRPSVQVGDPFSEKLLIEASLELIRRGLVVGFQDLGAGGISCPTAEMPAKAGTGLRIDASAVHVRENGMEPFEIMISESQERMMAVVEPDRVDEVLEVCSRWGLEAVVLGEVTKSQRLEVVADGEMVADVPVLALAEEGPVYQRPLQRPAWLDDLQRADPGGQPPDDLRKSFLSVLGSPVVASKRWVWEQYDHMIFLGTVIGPGGDAAVVRLPDREVAVALSVDGPGRFCQLDPYEGARLAVAESARNVACTGARPLAVTNCLNFGNPEKPEVMWQFAEAVRGIGDACDALRTPVTGGNVSFYNETEGRAIYPTPVIGMLGSLASASDAVGLGFRSPGDAIVLLGETRADDFGGSEFAKVVHGTVAGRPPRLDMEAEVALQRFLVAEAATFVSAHDLSEGGLAVALAEAALANGIGFSLDDELDHVALFSESPSRVLLSCAASQADELVQRARDGGVLARIIGRTGGGSLGFGSFSVDLDEADRVYGRALPDLLSNKVG